MATFAQSQIGGLYERTGIGKFNSVASQTKRRISARSDQSPAHHLGTRSGGVGRPFYTLDWTRLKSCAGITRPGLMSLGINVRRQTLYRHMACKGRPTKRPYSNISDSYIDEIVSGIVLQHPESGAIIVLGHFAAKGIKVPLIRVKDCLRRVDPIGVMLR